jgi:hypothetical protein
MDWMESIDKATFDREAAPRNKKVVTFEPRTRTTWVELPYSLGFCEVPAHDEVMKTLTPEQKVYRDKYPTRWVIDINGVKVCRDCFLAEADKDDTRSTD